MDTETQAQKTAWQPLTPAGVARFAMATVGRLMVAQLAVALVVAATVIWFCAVRIGPVISLATQRLPEEAALRNGNLVGAASGLLAESRFISLGVELEGAIGIGTADLQLKFAQDGFDVCSLLGCVSLYYPQTSLGIGRSVAEPWWGAWQPVIIVMIGVKTVIFLFLSWNILALLYQWIARFGAWFGDRDLSPRGSRLLAGAGQLPAALFVAAAILLYGMQVIDLVRFLVFYALHFVIAWIYIFVAAFFVKRDGGGRSLSENPFASAQEKA